MFQTLAQAADSYTYELQSTEASSSISPVIIIIYLAVLILLLASIWKVFQKAGKPGWASIVPLYNSWVMIQIAGKPSWWFFMMFVPFANIVFAIMLYVEIAKRFGKGGGFAALLILLPFVGFPILGFGKAQYQAASVQPINNGPDNGGGMNPTAPFPPAPPQTPVV